MFTHREQVNDSTFRCTREFIPLESQEEVIEENGDVTVIKKKKSKYLPGERLLINLNKQNKKKNDEFNFEKISESLQRIIGDMVL